MRTIVSGGGTAGHVYPASTVAELLSAGGRDEVVFVGTPDGLEARLVPAAGIRFESLPARGIDRSRPLSALAAVAVIAVSTVRALRIVRRFRPDVVLGFGGYVSLPVGFAALLSGVPLVLAEQNSVPGLANRVLSRWARAVAVTYPESSARLARPERAVVTGNPVRDAVLKSNREAGRRALGLPDDALVLLVFGGSRGARHLNETIVDLYPRLAEVPRLRVVHVAGSIEVASVTERLQRVTGGGAEGYRVVDYIDRMGDAIAAADLVVARAGATSIAEITALGKPSVLVPYPYATDDHQTRNAASVAEAGGAVVVADRDLDEPAFGALLLGLLGEPERREAMARAAADLGRPDAGGRVVALARDAAGEPRDAADGRE